jgi:hypothetical protein
MLKTYLFAFIIGIQTVIGLNFTTEILEAKQTNTDSGYDSRPVAQSVKPATNLNIQTKQVDYVKKLADLGITLHPGKEYLKTSSDNPAGTKKCAALVYKTLKAMPEETTGQLKNLTLYFTPDGRRGLGGGSTIILRCQNISDGELASVLVHELGHIQDTGVMKGNYWVKESEFKDGKSSIYQDDPSLGFYRLSFSNETTLKKSATEDDFVSGYAMTDPFEDFAETYNFYVLHGENFRTIMKDNNILRKKYIFMRDTVFHGQEFSNDSGTDFSLFTGRNYDSTVIGYNLENFLAYS